MGYVVTVQVFEPDGRIKCFAIVRQRAMAAAGYPIATFETEGEATDYARAYAKGLLPGAIPIPSRPAPDVIVASGETLELGRDVELLPDAWGIPDDLLLLITRWNSIRVEQFGWRSRSAIRTGTGLDLLVEVRALLVEATEGGGTIVLGCPYLLLFKFINDNLEDFRSVVSSVLVRCRLVDEVESFRFSGTNAAQEGTVGYG